MQYRLSKEVTLVHSSLHEPEEWHYVRISRMAEDSFEHQETPICFFGHTHVSQIFLRRAPDRPEALNGSSIHFTKDETYLVNPGSVGQPRNGDAQAQFALLDEATMTLEFAHVPYDVEAAVEAIQGAGLPRLLGERLREGY
jgi:diadenosine tetraphosphatase ApaH/serine/threonine PP2A family protein phosphatase